MAVASCWTVSFAGQTGVVFAVDVATNAWTYISATVYADNECHQ